MSEPSYALQLGMATALLASSDLVALIGPRVFDSLSAVGQPYPFAEIGDDQVISEPVTCGEIWEVWSNVHIWAAGADGRHMAKQASAAIGVALTTPFAVTGFTLVSALFHDARHRTDPDPTNGDRLIAHSIVSFRFRLIPAP